MQKLKNFRTRFFINILFILILISTIFFCLSFILDQSNTSVDSNILKNTNDFLLSFFPMELSYDLLKEIFYNSITTLSIASLSVFISTIISIPLVLFNLNNSTKTFKKLYLFQPIINFFLRFNLLFMRSLPELILALLFIRIFGLGASAGLFAIIFTYIGFLSKVFIEIIQSTDQSYADNLKQNGCSKTKAFIYGILPLCSKDLMIYVLFRWECAIRTSVVLGLVGAGGLGQQLDYAIKMMALSEVSTIIACIIILVYFSDKLSDLIKKILN